MEVINVIIAETGSKLSVQVFKVLFFDGVILIISLCLT